MQSIISGKYDIWLRQCVQGSGLVYCFINKGTKVQELLYLYITIQLYLKMRIKYTSSTSPYLPDPSFCLLILPKSISYGWFDCRTLPVFSAYSGIATINYVSWGNSLSSLLSNTKTPPWGLNHIFSLEYFQSRCIRVQLSCRYFSTKCGHVWW